MAKSSGKREFSKQPEKRKQLHTREIPLGYQQILQQKLYKPEEHGMIYSNCCKEKPVTKYNLSSKAII